jgi:tRNA(Ile)-lysidine synthase
VSRKEVLRYIAKRKLKYREDASNADRRFLRNRVRRELLPLLERDYNPGIRKVLRRTAEILRAEAAKEPVAWQRRAIRRQLKKLSFQQVETLRKQLSLPIEGEWRVKMSGKTVIRELGITFVCHSEPVEESLESKSEICRHTTDGPLRFRFAQNDKEGAECFDADTLEGKLVVRTWRAGDVFQPLGMKGEKKLQDFFVDEKVPRQERSRVPLLCASDGRIAWVVGYRIAEPFKVTERTRRVLRLRVTSAAPHRVMRSNQVENREHTK